MCFHLQQSKSAKELENRFKAKFKSDILFTPKKHFNGFEFPLIPVITNNESDLIQLIQWGLIPSWSKDDAIKQFTLNARIETLSEKASFKNILNKRCLVLADGFYEWKWLDAKGKNKEKYLITLNDKSSFAFGGLWSEWKDNMSGNIIHTYTIVTTEATGIMREIHNSKLRMPVILHQHEESAWLKGLDHNEFKKREIDLYTEKL